MDAPPVQKTKTQKGRGQKGDRAVKASTLILVTLLVLLLITIVGACAPSPEMIANETQQASGGAQPTQPSFFAPLKPVMFTYPDVGVACFVQTQIQQMVCLKVQ